MAKASEQFRQSDVTLWGIVALVCGATAMLGANISAVIPQSLLAGLHKTRLEGASVEQLRQQVSDLRADALDMRRDATILETRFALQQQSGSEVVQRVGALEVSLPKLLEALPDNAQIDRASVTASIGDNQALTYDAEGGSVMVRQRPLELPAMTAPQQPIPAPLTTNSVLPDETAFGIAVGPSVAFEDAAAAWNDLSNKLGPLLFGLAPLLVDEADSETKRIVVGPITQLTEATALCARLERVAISCMPMPFTGTPLTL